MKEFFLRRLARRFVREIHLYGYYRPSPAGALQEVGWFRSFREGKPVDSVGNPIPCLTYPAIAFLATRIQPWMSVFEYGAGVSTLWWGRLAKQVIACEHDVRWHRKISSTAPANVTVHWVPLDDTGQYAQFVSRWAARFDVVVIDGRDRVNCARNCLSALAPAAVIIWDNSDRQCYRPGFEFLGSQGFRRLDFVGMAPMNTESSETAIFYRDQNCLGI